MAYFGAVTNLGVSNGALAARGSQLPGLQCWSTAPVRFGSGIRAKNVHQHGEI